MIDTHCHLNDKAFEKDYRDIILSFKNNNIEKVVCASFDLDSSEKGIQLAKDFSGVVYASVGIHPHYSKNITSSDFLRLQALLDEKEVRALGETGLDYYYPDTDRKSQREVFLRHLHILKKTNLPLIVHVRDAFADCIDILSSNKDCVRNRGVIHCYSGSYESAKIFLDLGYYIAFGGAITFKNNTTSASIIEKIPLDLILTETDCPYLAPQANRGQRNEPKFMRQVVERIAQIKGLDFEAVEAQTSLNAKTLFKI